MKVKKYVLAVLVGAMTFPALSDWEASKGFVGLGLSNGENLLLPDNGRLTTGLIPELSLGLSKAYRLDQNWLIDSSLSAEWAEGDFQFGDMGIDKSNAENLGLWASSRLIRENWFENASPFIELGVGRVRGDFGVAEKQTHEWATAARARVGMMFTLSEDSDFSISIGTSNFLNH